MLLSSGSSAELRGHEKDVSKVGAFPFFKKKKGELLFFLSTVGLCLFVCVCFVSRFVSRRRGLRTCGVVVVSAVNPYQHLNPNIPPPPFSSHHITAGMEPPIRAPARLVQPRQGRQGEGRAAVGHAGEGERDGQDLRRHERGRGRGERGGS